jgi:hypothetical protein
MKIVRSILAIVVGALLAFVVVGAGDALSMVLFMPAEWTSEKVRKAMEEDPQKLADLFKTMPVEALMIMVAGWGLAAFLGGLVAAFISGWARCWHAGIIGGVLLIAIVVNFYRMTNLYDIAHPDWMIVAGLLLPLPLSLIAGKLVSMILPSAPAAPQS